MENVFLCEKRCAFCYNVRWRPFSFFHFIDFCKYLYFVILRARNKWPLYILCRIVNYHWHFDIFIHIPKRQKKHRASSKRFAFLPSNQTKQRNHYIEWKNTFRIQQKSIANWINPNENKNRFHDFQNEQK